MSIYEYARLIEKEKKQILKDQALLIERSTEGGNEIHLYFFNGFFIEVTLCSGKVIDNIPYKRGFKVNTNTGFRMAA